MKTGRGGRLSLFWGYLSFYAVLVAVTMLLLGALLNGIFMRSIRENMRQSAQSRADHVCADLDAQMDSMRTLSLKLSVQRMYQHSYFARNKYREIELLESLSQYQAYSGLATEFGLIYPGHDLYVFSSTGGKAELSAFLGRYGLKETGDVVSFVRDGETSPRFMVKAGHMLSAYDLSMSGGVDGTDRGVLLLVTPTQAIEERMKVVGDIDAGMCSLYLRGTQILDSGCEADVTAKSREGFYLETEIPTLKMSGLMWTRGDSAMFAGVVGALIVCILLLTYWCYRPIRRLAQRYAFDHGSRKNELAALGMTLEQLQNTTQDLRGQAMNRSRMLKNYMLLMLLNHNVTPGMREDMEKAGVRLDRPLYFVMAVCAKKGESVSRENADTLQRSLTDIGEDVADLYTVECDPEEWMLAVVCAVEQAEDRDVVARRTRSYLSAQRVELAMGEGPLVESLEKVSYSYLIAAQMAKEARGTMDGETGEKAGETEGRAERIRSVAERIRAGDEAGAMAAAMEALDDMEAEAPARRGYARFELMSALHELCGQAGLGLTEEQMADMAAPGDAAARRAAGSLIPALCQSLGGQEERGVVSAAQLVMEYLSAHSGDWDISARQVAEEVGVGINRVNAIVREQTGQSCKSYITALRMKTACRMLTETGSPVGDIAQSVGYNSASYFIKVFKDLVGETPDAYRKNHQEET